MKHDIAHLKERWKRIKFWCRVNELKCILYIAITTVWVTLGLVALCPW